MNTPAGELMAWFGPAISQPAFEVQDDVRDAFVSMDEKPVRHIWTSPEVILSLTG